MHGNLSIRITSVCCNLLTESFSIYQRTPLDVAFEGGYVDIVEHFRGTGMSKVNV